MAVQIDMVDGGRARKTADGWEFTRIALVSGIAGAGHAKLKTAVDAIGIAIGAEHPTVASATLEHIDAEHRSVDVVACSLVYRERGQSNTIQITARLEERETNKDKDGDPMAVSYTDGDGNVRSQTGAVPVLRPRRVLRFTVQADDDPSAAIESVLGKVNAEGWFHDPEPEAAGKWMCAAIESHSRDGGETWEVTYEFQYREEGWDVTVAYTDPETGRPPPDVEDGDGLETYTVYTEADFNTLPAPVGSA